MRASGARYKMCRLMLLNKFQENYYLHAISLFRDWVVKHSNLSKQLTLDFRVTIYIYIYYVLNQVRRTSLHVQRRIWPHGPLNYCSLTSNKVCISNHVTFFRGKKSLIQSHALISMTIWIIIHWSRCMGRNSHTIILYGCDYLFMNWSQC